MLEDFAPDFEAKIRIYTEAEGGRRTPVFQDYRPQFKYLDDETSDYDIWPL